MADTDKQIAIAERLQLKWLEHMEKMIDEGNITSTDMATLARLLVQSGWTLDPKQVPQRLMSKLTNVITFDDDLESDRKLKLG